MFNLKNLIIILVLVCMFIIPVAAVTVDSNVSGVLIEAPIDGPALENPLTEGEQDILNVVALWVGKILLLLGMLTALDPTNKLNLYLRKFSFIFTFIGKKIPPDK